MTLKYLLEKEFKQILRNPFLPRMIVLFPIAIMCIMPWVANQEVKNIRVDIVDHDHSATSRELTRKVMASRYFIFNAQAPSYAAALSDVERAEADVILDIPPHYERDCVRQDGSPILIAANAADPMKGSMGASYLSQIVTDHLAADVSQMAAKKVNVLNLYNKNLNYKVFMIPALMGILLMLFCGFLPTLNIVSEKECGTIEQINVTPVGKVSFILSKLIPYFLLALFVMTACFVLSWLVYGITCQGPLGLVYLISILLAMTFSGIGLIISNHSGNMQQAILVMWFIVVCLMLLSGIFTPVRSMPDWVQYIVAVNPVHYYVDAVRTVFVRGGGFSAIWQQAAVLSLFAFVMDAWAMMDYKKNAAA